MKNPIMTVGNAVKILWPSTKFVIVVTLVPAKFSLVGPRLGDSLRDAKYDGTPSRAS